ncbi:hypothetical protein [Ammoniphilus sp. CFH 90114]|uniref:hypothetical protein n=1 Tax=Ammoniphilus sp. CFH 90114 TaxID=2493665 RepID=UPI00100FFB6C|nr:hypothetical protein [Ammoniphilus sp. CFH 90114]RXT04181.1 hypothetical protein EIZ39_21645 [Ammoniphilus sp. CFH 90114]
MEKKRFYVNVEHGSILEDQGAETYEFEVDADEMEIHKLQELFDKTHQKEMGTIVRGMTPYIQYHDDEDNDEYDRSLLQVYRMLHQLGTPQTKQHIESMEIL